MALIIKNKTIAMINVVMYCFVFFIIIIKRYNVRFPHMKYIFSGCKSRIIQIEVPA